MIIHSALNYTGGKWKIMEYLLKLFPKNINNFLDLFCGGLNVSLNINANHIYANDIYTPVMDIYKTIYSYHSFEMLNNDINKIIQEFNLSTEEGYLNLRKSYNQDKSPLKLLTLAFYAFNNLIRFNHSNEFNASYGKGDLTYSLKKQEELKAMFDIIKHHNIVFSDLNFTEFNY
jgi:DNA adenine methylase Dam